MSDVRIETERLQLRPCSQDEVDDLHRLWTDPHVRKFLWDDQIIARETVVEVIESSRESFAADGFGLWVVSRKEDPRLIGFCGLRYFAGPQDGKRPVELLYAIAPEYCGMGLATEAAVAVVRRGFEKNGLARIYAGADPPNSASFRVMEKVGMRYERHATINGLEAIYYVINREDFPPGD
jgi:ribosomal-protein-alanine N-acetyltransferase